MMVKKAGKKINFKYMDKAQAHNSDGYGVAWYEDDMVKTYKTFNYNQFKGVVGALKQHTIVVHLRYTTKGATTYENIHPFDIPSGVMFHNGTIFSIKTKGNVSDSRTLANRLSECEYKYIEDIEPLISPMIDDKINRLVFFEDNGRVSIMNKELGIEEDGAWYSNDYHLKDEGWCRSGCKPKVTKTKEKTNMQLVKKETKEYPWKEQLRTHKVFVYGTLKRGGSNFKYFLKDAVFLGKANTVKKWTMVGKDAAFPYVIEQHNLLGNNIVGEVFAVNKDELNALDRLEGVPHHYRKNTIGVKYADDDTVEEVTMYTKAFYSSKYMEGQELLTEWSA